MALATDKPTNESAASQGTLGVAAYLPSSTHGGARRADDVADQMKISTKSTIDTAGTPLAASGVANGMSRNATQETAVTTRMGSANRPYSRITRSAIRPSAT